VCGARFILSMEGNRDKPRETFVSGFFLNKKKRIKPTTNALLCLYFVLLKIEKQQDE
jgi:hypothetical protein